MPGIIGRWIALGSSGFDMEEADSPFIRFDRDLGLEGPADAEPDTEAADADPSSGV